MKGIIRRVGSFFVNEFLGFERAFCPPPGPGRAQLVFVFGWHELQLLDVYSSILFKKTNNPEFLVDSIVDSTIVRVSLERRMERMGKLRLELWPAFCEKRNPLAKHKDPYSSGSDVAEAIRSFHNHALGTSVVLLSPPCGCFGVGQGVYV